MSQHIALVTYLVKDYDEAIAWFHAALGFKRFEDTDMGGGKRWVVMGPDTSQGARFLLAKAASQEQATAVGKAAGERVAYFLHTDDFARDHAKMRSAAASFIEAPPARKLWNGCRV